MGKDKICKGWLKKGKSRKEGQTCIPNCKRNYVPDVTELLCTADGFKPPTFTCRQNLKWRQGTGKIQCVFTGTPVFGVVEQPFQEVTGRFVNQGESVTPNCEEGYSSDVSKMVCDNEKFTPMTYVCSPT